MHSTEIAIPTRFQSSDQVRSALVQCGGTTVPGRERSTWARFVAFLRDGRGGVGPASDRVLERPRPDVRRPFC